MHTAVALELSAGQARAAGPTRMQGRLTTPPPRRPTRTTLTGPGRRRLAGQRAPPEARAMARTPPPGIAASSLPSGTDRQVKPCIQLEESASGFRYKQTDSDAHRRVKPPTLKWRGRRPRAGLQHTVARERPPAANYPGPHVRPLPLLLARGSPPSGLGRRSCSRAAGATRGPGDGPETTPPGIAASSPPSGGGKRYWIVRLDARLSRPHRPQSATQAGGQPLPTMGPCYHPDAD